MLRRVAVRLRKDIVRLRYRDDPVPLETLMRIRRFAGRPGAVTFRARSRPRDAGEVLDNRFLAERLAGTELGNWTLSGAVLNVLEAEIRRVQPDLVLELGSGVSTACLARYLHELHGDTRLRVLSVENDPEHAVAAAARVQELGLEGVARVFHAPLVERVHRGHALFEYALPAELTDVLRDRPPGLVLVDGPGVDPACSRFTSLEIVRPYLAPGTPFFFDDALQDYGLEIGGWLSELDGVRLDGIRLVGHGLLVGRTVEG